MPVRYELFATGSASPAALWDVVGDLRRLPEWTDLEAVVAVEPEPPTTGTTVAIRDDGKVTQWRVTTAEPHLWELQATTERGEVGIGIRVRPDPLGARLILAGYHETRGALTGLRTRLVDAPALRRRFDRWAERALAAASQPRP